MHFHVADLFVHIAGLTVQMALHIDVGQHLAKPGKPDVVVHRADASAPIQILHKGGAFGVKLKAGAPSIHMIRVDIDTEINPMVGTEQQTEDMVRYLLKEFEEDPKSIWGSNLFGKSLYELINEGLHNKLEHMPEESRKKLSETLERIINEGSNGLICILL